MSNNQCWTSKIPLILPYIKRCLTTLISSTFLKSANYVELMVRLGQASGHISHFGGADQKIDSIACLNFALLFESKTKFHFLSLEEFLYGFSCT